MLRVIRSTVQGLDIDPDLEDAFAEAIQTALDNRDQVRETFATDDAGQKDYHLALLPYTDPTGAHRWAVLDSGPSEVDWQDTDDLEEAIAAYEEWVRGATDGAVPDHDDEGNEKPLWDESDVDGIKAEETLNGDSANQTARMLDAVWAHEAFPAAEEAYRQATQRRQVAFARVIDSWGRGGQAMLGSRIKLSEPTVKAIADKGRQILAEREPKS
ncbi:hypothetical protein [Streptomyces sp. NPDC055105]|uniref:hypothetical protein n=1 Tax=Streptomyces sp. NPDC055105 TaxID=3365719 RepID=UPI0037D8E846